jgi:cardiolipin synthase
MPDQGGSTAASRKPTERAAVWWGVPAAVAVVVLAGCSGPHSSVASGLRSTAQDATYQLIQEPDAGYGPVIGVIDQAHQSIRMTIYELQDPHTIDSLIAAHGRGVDVRVFLNSAFHGNHANEAAFDDLSTAGVNVRWAPATTIWHQKTVSVDDNESLVGTGNFTPQYYASSRDAWVLDSRPDEVAAITATFDSDFGATQDAARPPAAAVNPNLIWSPDARGAFLQQIEGATHSVDVTSEEFSDSPTIRALANAAQRGVACRVVLTANSRWTKGIGEVSAAGCSVHLLPPDAPLYMHEKILFTDEDTLTIGSQNLSTTSLLKDRELSLRLTRDDAGPVLDAVRSTFEADYAQATPA